MEAVCYSETMSFTDKAARLYGLEYHSLSTNCLFALCFHLTTLVLPRSHRVMNWRGLGQKPSWGNLGITAAFLTKHDGEHVRRASDPGEVLNGDFTNKNRSPCCRSPILYTGVIKATHIYVLNIELL